MCAQVNDNRGTVSLQDKMEHCRNVLRRTWWLLNHLGGDRYKCGEKFSDKIGQYVILLAESAGKGLLISQPHLRITTYLKARTASKVATHPAWTSRTSLLTRRRLISPTKEGHLVGKSWATIDLRVLASWRAMLLEGEAARRGRTLMRRASRSEGAMTTWSGLRAVSME